jgi:hypothetical protein
MSFLQQQQKGFTIIYLINFFFIYGLMKSEEKSSVTRHQHIYIAKIGLAKYPIHYSTKLKVDSFKIMFLCVYNDAA